MKPTYPAYTLLSIALCAIGTALMFAWPEAAPVVFGLAWLVLLPDFKKHTARLQFIMLFVTTAAWGLSLDNLGGRSLWFTGSMLLAALALGIRQMGLHYFTLVRYRWLEPAILLCGAFLLVRALQGGSLAGGLPWMALPPFVAALGLCAGYLYDGALIRRKVANGYRVKVGDVAPDFALLDQEGRLVQLSDFIGRHPVLLVFLRGDWCPGCHIMLRTYEKNRERFLEKDVHVLGIAPDGVEKNKEVVERIGMGYALLSDQRNQVSRGYGVVYSNAGLESAVNYADGIPLPASFLVDVTGVVRYVSRPERVGEFLDPARIFKVLGALPGHEERTWKAA